MSYEQVSKDGSTSKFNESKAVRMILKGKRRIWDFYPSDYTERICMANLLATWYSGNVPNHNNNDELFLMAVKEGYELEYVYNKTPEICLAAVKINGNVLRVIEDQTNEICLEAIASRPFAIEYVRNQTPELCLAAFRSAIDNSNNYVDIQYKTDVCASFMNAKMLNSVELKKLLIDNGMFLAINALKYYANY